MHESFCAQIRGRYLHAGAVLVRAGGDEVVVVYNKHVPESKAVAEYYAKMRQVPARQIYGFDLTTNEQMSRDEFRDSLQMPLAQQTGSRQALAIWLRHQCRDQRPAGTVEHRVVASKIRYVVLCHGVPLKIAPAPVSHEPGKEIAHPELLRDEAAVDSELAWLPLVEMGVSLAGPLHNWVYGTTNTACSIPPTAFCWSRGSTAQTRTSRAGWWTRRSQPSATVCGDAPTSTRAA